MPEKPKEQENDRELESKSEKRDERDAWAADQEKHEYYYDDAHGYETFDPNEEDTDPD